LKSSLKKAYKEVRVNNQKAHQKNNAYYDKKAKEWKFETNDKVYLFCPARKPGRCHKFRSFWQGPFIVVQKLSDLNYKIVNKQGKVFVVHINRLMKSYCSAEYCWTLQLIELALHLCNVDIRTLNLELLDIHVRGSTATTCWLSPNIANSAVEYTPRNASDVLSLTF